ncbi:MAG: hypothetical protein ACR2PH_05575 [Desulfobulbia bacterium]
MSLKEQLREMDINEIISHIENGLYYGDHRNLAGEDIVDLMQLIYKLARIAKEKPVSEDQLTIAEKDKIIKAVNGSKRFKPAERIEVARKIRRA